MISVPSPTGLKFCHNRAFSTAENAARCRRRPLRQATSFNARRRPNIAVTGCYQPPPGIFVKNQNTTIKWMEMGMKWWHGGGIVRLWGGLLEFRGGAGWLLRIAAAGFGGGGSGRSTATMASRFALATATAAAAAATTTAMEGAAKAVAAIVVAATMAATTAMVMVTEVTAVRKCWLRRQQRQLWWWRRR